jgi:hypothetical protein
MFRLPTRWSPKKHCVHIERYKIACSLSASHGIFPIGLLLWFRNKHCDLKTHFNANENNSSQIFLETSVYSPLKHLTPLPAQEIFIQFF